MKAVQHEVALLKIVDAVARAHHALQIEADAVGRGIFQRKNRFGRRRHDARAVDAQAIALLREKGITCLAAALYQSQPLSAAKAGYPGGVCVVIGSEGQGLTDETIAACNSTVRIPMTDRVESLNAGIAGSILLWHFREESL